MSTLSPEIWYLIFQALDTRHDLGSVCQVCKSFNALATPVLYRSIILRTSRPKPRGRRGLAHWIKDQGRTKNYLGSFSLLSRLLEGPSTRLRRFVRVIELGQERYSRDIPKLFKPYGDPEAVMIRLIESLPNLESLCVKEAFPLSGNLIDALCKHKNAPAVHLLGERGSTQVERQVPCVQSLDTCVRIYLRGMERGETSLALHELFFAYPNLKNLSVGLDFYRNRGRTGGSPLPEPVTRLEPLTLGETDSFPPIQRLSLSDYPIDAEEWQLWEKKFPWANLKSLALGPVPSHLFLQQIKGYAQNLSNFELYAYSRVEMHSCPELTDFLLSFDTLEALTVKQCWPSLDAVAHHSKLKSLTFHATENREKKRPLLDLEDLEFLDEMCTELEFLEIDIRREDGWPEEVVAGILRGFANLRHLSLHVGLEIHQGIIEPTLTKITANEFAEILSRYGVSKPKLKRVTLKTGEDLRDFREVKPRYVREEEDCAAVFDIRAPHDGIGEWIVEENTVE